MAGLKQCSRCAEYKLPDQFSKKSAKCRPCAVTVTAEWRKSNPERTLAWSRSWRSRSEAAERIEEYRIKYRYGLTVAQRDALMNVQCDACAICREPFEKAPHIDHCHATGVVRGLLCDRCNRGLGYFKDTPERLRAAADYIERNS